MSYLAGIYKIVGGEYQFYSFKLQVSECCVNDIHIFQYFILNLTFVVDLSYLYAVGYSTCHWCHVMERESFESEEIAQILNDKFVSVKVDREERPDVDKVYMTYIQVKSSVQKLT